MFVRARTQCSALRQRFDASQQGAETGVGRTYLASLQLILTQSDFAQIFRLREPSTCVHPILGHCLAYAPPQREWIHGTLLPWMEEMLASAEMRTDVYNPRTVLGLRERLRGAGGETLAWRVASTEAWYRLFIDESPQGYLGQAEIASLEW